MRPATHYPWAVDDGRTQTVFKGGEIYEIVNKQQPVDSFKDTGITYNIGMPIQYWNYQINGIHKWVKHLDQRHAPGDVITDLSTDVKAVSNRLGGEWRLLSTIGTLNYYWKVSETEVV